VVLGLNSEPLPWATPTAPFCEVFFCDKVWQTVCLDWLWTVILLISASWVARITGVSHQHSALTAIFISKYINYSERHTNISNWLYTCFFFLLMSLYASYIAKLCVRSKLDLTRAILALTAFCLPGDLGTHSKPYRVKFIRLPSSHGTPQSFWADFW
jgi:hypothetical protein